MKLIIVILFILIASNGATAGPKLKLKDGPPAATEIDLLAGKKTGKKDFSFTINPYLWMMGAAGTVSIVNTPSGYPKNVSFNESFADAVKNLKFAFMAAGKIRYKSVALLYDVVYANLKSFDVSNPQGKGLVTGDISLKEFITDLAIAYSIPSKSKTAKVDVYAGTRIWAMDQEITLDPTDPNLPLKMFSNSNNWVDPVIGVKADFSLSEDWFAYAKSDFGGFGANSDWTLMAIAGCGYKFNPNWNTSLGIKYLGVEYNKDNLYLNIDEYGLALTVGYWM